MSNCGRRGNFPRVEERTLLTLCIQPTSLGHSSSLVDHHTLHQTSHADSKERSPGLGTDISGLFCWARDWGWLPEVI